MVNLYIEAHNGGQGTALTLKDSVPPNILLRHNQYGTAFDDSVPQDPRYFIYRQSGKHNGVLPAVHLYILKG